MKHSKTTKSLATLLLVTTASTQLLNAIERPIPADQPKEKKAQQVKPNQKEKALPMPRAQEADAQRPYLGVLGDSISEAMSAQFKLEQGVGLTLLFVDQNSPAGKAGLKSSLLRPIAFTTFALNYYFHQYEIFGYHVVNITIHILTGFFLYLFIKATLSIPSESRAAQQQQARD